MPDWYTSWDLSRGGVSHCSIPSVIINIIKKYAEYVITTISINMHSMIYHLLLLIIN